MKITKYPQSCVMVEINNKKILIDAGGLKYQEKYFEAWKKADIILITHKHPDGDAIGSSFALYFALLKMGKKVIVDIGNKLPSIYNFVCDGNYSNKHYFEPDFIVSVDLADTKLLLEHLKFCENKIDLAIDHHASNTLYANNTLLYKNAASVGNRNEYQS